MPPLPAAMDSPGARACVPASPVQEDQRPYVNLDKLQNDNVEREELCHHQRTYRWGLEHSIWAGRPAVSGVCVSCSHR